MYRPRDPLGWEWGSTGFGVAVDARSYSLSGWGVFRGSVGADSSVIPPDLSLRSPGPLGERRGGLDGVTPHTNGLALYNVPGAAVPPRRNMTPALPAAVMVGGLN